MSLLQLDPIMMLYILKDLSESMLVYELNFICTKIYTWSLFYGFVHLSHGISSLLYGFFCLKADAPMNIADQ
jgi:hypothetical protein